MKQMITMKKRSAVLPILMLFSLAFFGVAAAQVISDGSFENQTSTTLSDPWWIDGGTTIEVELGTGEAFDGNNNVVITTTSVGEWIAIGQDLTVEENTDYIVKFYVKADNNIYWGGDPDDTKGYMKVTDAFGDALADNDVPRGCDGTDFGAPWTPGELLFGCDDMSYWREYTYLFNSGANTEVYLVIGTYVNNVLTWRVDGFSVTKFAPANTFTDGDFEAQTSATLADPCWIDGGTTIEVELGTGEAFDGSNNVVLTTTSGGEWIAIGQDLPVEENTDYAVKFYLKADNNIFWDGEPAWSKGYMAVIDVDWNKLADNNVPRGNDGATGGIPWAPGDLVYGAYDMTDWREYVYCFNSGPNTEVYLILGTFVNNVVTVRADGFSMYKSAEAALDVADTDQVPLMYALKQNYPNPFNPTTTFEFTLEAAGPVNMAVYDLAGHKIRTLVDESMAPGTHSVTWDGRDDAGIRMSAGVYFYRLTAGSVTMTKKMMLMK
jgi:hypothetical protein